MAPSDHEVIIDWAIDRNWNEVCANIVEVFGLPGSRFVYTPDVDYMTFCFKSIKDANLCKILLSEYL